MRREHNIEYTEPHLVIADSRTHTHTKEAQFLSSKAPHINHTEVSRTCRHAPPSQYIRVVYCHHSLDHTFDIWSILSRMPSRETCQFAVRSVTLELALNHRPVSKRDAQDAPSIRAGHTISCSLAHTYVLRIGCHVRHEKSSINASPPPARQTSN